MGTKFVFNSVGYGVLENSFGLTMHLGIRTRYKIKYLGKMKTILRFGANNNLRKLSTNNKGKLYGVN